MGSLISRDEIIKIMDYGKSQGWNEQQCLEVVSQKDYRLKVAAEKARVAKENKRLEEEAKAKYDQDILEK